MALQAMHQAEEWEQREVSLLLQLPNANINQVATHLTKLEHQKSCSSAHWEHHALLLHHPDAAGVNTQAESAPPSVTLPFSPVWKDIYQEMGNVSVQAGTKKLNRLGLNGSQSH